MSITAKEKKLLATAISNAKKRNQMYEINMEKDILDIFGVVRDFIKSERVLCYGGTAINAALDPKVMCVWGPERARDEETAAFAQEEQEKCTGDGYDQGYLSDICHGFW